MTSNFKLVGRKRGREKGKESYEYLLVCVCMHNESVINAGPKYTGWWNS